jgi:4-amino-4-deoxy-L-arabinose transferase-like glycosyltransferase
LTDRSKTRGAGTGRESLVVLACCAAASAAAVVWSWRHGAMLNYGDAIAHLHIARRVFDCHQPRLSQLGSVWLPLPHILMLPFVQVYAWWANGLAGTIPSVLAHLAACVGLYQLARRWMRPAEAAVALAFFALNPNLLYLQTTAMTEPLFLAEMIWIVLLLVEWRTCVDDDAARATRLQCWIAVALVAAVFTRYDGWIIALIAWTGIGLGLLKRGRLKSWAFWIASAAVVAAPMAWFVYNAAAFGDWLEFARGPYSAKAIELRTAVHGAGPLHPGWHDPWVSLLFYLKVSEMDAAALRWGNTLLALSALGTAWGWLTKRKHGFDWALLLWLPVPFYAYSVAYGSVPIFLPAWWPHSWYNTRYGMELLPALALGVGFVAQFVVSAAREFKPKSACYATALLLALVGWNEVALTRQHPLVYVEGTKNRDSRVVYDAEVPAALKEMLRERPGAVILMNTSVHPEFVAQAGFPLRQTINESDLSVYKDALAAPAAHAAVVLAFDGDDVDQAVKAHPEGLTAVRRFTEKGQPDGTLYVSDAAGAMGLNRASGAVIASVWKFDLGNARGRDFDARQ